MGSMARGYAPLASIGTVATVLNIPPFGIEMHEAGPVTFARLLEVLNEGVWFIDADGITLFANPRMAEMLGTTVEAMLGSSPLHYYVEDDHALLLEHLRLRQEGRSTHYEVRLRRTDGELIDVRVHGSPVVVDDVVVGSVGAFTDLTDLRRAALAQEEALRQAEESKATTTRLVSWVSHELRTPLNTVVGFAQLLHQRLERAGDREMADHILAAGRHVTSLVEDLLAFSRAEAEALQPHLEQFDMLDAVEGAMALTAGAATEASVHFDLHVAAEPIRRAVVADRRQLTQVLVNLLSNAVKYGGREAEVTISVEHDDEWVRCTVTDRGPGIPAHLQRAVFRPFERLENARHVVGVGLGLAIAESFVRGMHGSLTLASEPDSGAAFTVSLPHAHTDTATSESSTAAPRDTAATTTHVAPLDATERLVLYVEDEPLNAALLESIIALLPGRRLRVEPTVADGLAALADTVPALALLDLNLPDGTGFDVLRALRDNPATRHVPVFILSADATEEAAHRALQMGADRYLTKPFDLNAFLTLIETATA